MTVARGALAQQPAIVPDRGSYASVVRRILAYVVDTAVLVIPVSAAGLIAVLNPLVRTVGEGRARTLADVVQEALCAAYFVTRWSSSGQTVGMRRLGIAVVDARTGLVMDRGRAMLRFIAQLVVLTFALLPLWLLHSWLGAVADAGLLMGVLLLCRVDSRKRGLWDRAASTVVVISH